MKPLSDRGSLGAIEWQRITGSYLSILLYVAKVQRGEVSSQGHSDTLHHLSQLYCVILATELIQNGMDW